MHTQAINQFRRVASKVTRGTAIAQSAAAVLALGALAVNGRRSEARRRQSKSSDASRRWRRRPLRRNEASRLSRRSRPRRRRPRRPRATAGSVRWPVSPPASGIAALLSSLGLGAGLAQMHVEHAADRPRR